MQDDGAKQTAYGRDAQAGFDKIHQAFVADFEGVLQSLLLSTPLAHELARPQRLLEAMRYGMLGGGKRLRPFLLATTVAALHPANADQAALHKNALHTGAALEMVHGYSLIHDDLPAMDDDDLRRGKPTVHKAFDEATAILAGDSLLTLAFDVLARKETHKDAIVRLALVQELARASGLGGMAGGQMLDLQAEQATTPFKAEAIEQLQAMKTGALLTFAVVAGGLLTGCEADVLTLLRQFGQKLGRAFQIRDDVLDARSSSAELGKAAGKDSARNKATFVALLGLDAAQNLVAEEVDCARATLRALCLKRPDINSETLLALCDFMIHRRV